jgi:lipid A 3-O-deacylase
MKNFPLLSMAAIASALLLAAPAAYADASATNGIYLQYGSAGSKSSTDAYTLGVTKPMNFSSSLLGMQATGYWDLYGTYHVSDNPAGKDYKTWLVDLTPTFRLRFDQGRSNWFVDGGVGVSYTDVLYQSDVKRFSTRFNFGTHVALGYTFGTNREQEISVRVQHYSNASIKKPNPGENYVQVRYAHAF